MRKRDQVDADLDAIVAFHRRLVRFNRLLETESEAIERQWRTLNSVWNDTQYDRFGEAFLEARKGIKAYLKATEGHETHLRRLIERLRGVLDLR